VPDELPEGNEPWIGPLRLVAGAEVLAHRVIVDGIDPVSAENVSFAVETVHSVHNMILSSGDDGRRVQGLFRDPDPSP
jgi:hypothetical protein